MNILVTGGSGFIGTNYIEYLLNLENVKFLNLDKAIPRNPAHKPYWTDCDLLNAIAVKEVVRKFSPTHVVHLAAETGVDKKKLNEFAANIEGVENLISALNEVGTVQQALFTSSLLVCKMGYIPKHDTDYLPSTIYGESKVKGEIIVRNANIDQYLWTIIRPISIWGPWGEEPYRNFFKAIAQGWYFHIGSGHYRRSLGYVGNTVHQIHHMLLAPAEKVDKKIMYVADDQPTDLYDMANMIGEAIGARKIFHIPLWMAKLAALIGDMCKIIGWQTVPISSFRLNNIRTEYIFDLSPIINISGPLPINMETGVKQTVQWLREMKEI